MDEGMKRRVYKKLEKLKYDPYKGKPLRYGLKGKRNYKVDRVYRIIFEIFEKDKILKVVTIKHRKKAY